jgi:hypothetical protein
MHARMQAIECGLTCYAPSYPPQATLTFTSWVAAPLESSDKDVHTLAHILHLHNTTYVVDSIRSLAGYIEVLVSTSAYNTRPHVITVERMDFIYARLCKSGRPPSGMSPNYSQHHSSGVLCQQTFFCPPRRSPRIGSPAAEAPPSRS